MTIKQKQWQLYYLGYYGGQTDGIWGAQSKAAAIDFQKDHGLKADGIFGAVSIAKSIERIKTIQKEITDGKIAIRCKSSLRCGMPMPLTQILYT